MRFKRYLRADPREVTPGRRRAAERAVRRDKDNNALTPELVRHETADERLAAQAVASRQFWQHMRDSRAASWRRARRMYRELDPHTRAGIRQLWERAYLPGDPTYLIELIKHNPDPWAKLAWFTELERRRLAGGDAAIPKNTEPVEA